MATNQKTRTTKSTRKGSSSTKTASKSKAKKAAAQPARKPPKPKPPESYNPASPRTLQLLFIIVIMGVLFSVFLGGHWGPSVVGFLLFATAFPPFRKSMDKWLVGKVRGTAANQAATTRMIVGVVIIVLAIIGAFGN